MKPPPIDPDHNPRVGEETLISLEIAHVFIPDDTNTQSVTESAISRLERHTAGGATYFELAIVEPKNALTGYGTARKDRHIGPSPQSVNQSINHVEVGHGARNYYARY